MKFNPSKRPDRTTDHATDQTIVPQRHRKSGAASEQGSALLISLLLLMLLSALSLGMFVTMSSDALINGFYRNQQSSYYAADSGITVARQYMYNQIQALETAPASFVAGTPPLPANSAATALTAVTTSFGNGTYYPINIGNAANSWGAKFTVLGNGNTSLTMGTPVGSLPNGLGQDTAYAYSFTYKITAVGESTGAEQQTLQENGSVTLSENPPPPSLVNFAGYGAFVNAYAPCLGPLAPGLFTGPTFTNGSWNFGNFSTQYIFTDPVGQQGADASYWFGSNCINSPTTSDTSGGVKIAPTFQAGYKLGQPNIPLPQDIYNQQEAAVDGKGTACPSSGSCSPGAPPSQATMGADLRNVSGTAWPSTGSTPSSGVYLPYSTSSTTCGAGHTPCFTGGGIYVQGNASMTLAATTNTAGNLTQTYTITQSSTVTTVVVNDVTNITTITSGSSVQTINGVPTQYDPTTGLVVGDATMLYVNGTITGLTGPYSGSTIQPAIQDGTHLTIASTGNVDVTGDITYKEEPVTTVATTSTPVDTAIAANANAGVLGIVTSAGNINLDVTNDPAATCHGCTPNIEVDGSLAAMSTANNLGGFTQSGPAINAFNNVGGQIQGNIYGANISIENTYFDRRFSNGTLPPWFPSTSVTGVGGSISYVPAYSRTQWINLSAVNASQ
jgi:Tfp pilus assembly protein PilX